MKKYIQNSRRLRTMTVIFLIFSWTAVSVYAATYTIRFGGTFGFSYSPSQLAVAVGDTIKWEGSFTGHPLSSTTIPQGAASFHVASGSTFSYPVLMAGTYNYICDFHVNSGMSGSFTASVSSIEDAEVALQPATFRLAQNYPNPFNARTIIQFRLPVAQNVKLKIYSLTGAEIFTLFDGFLPAGEYTVPFDAANLASGIYFYRLATEKYTDTKRLILSK